MTFIKKKQSDIESIKSFIDLVDSRINNINGILLHLKSEKITASDFGKSSEEMMKYTNALDTADKLKKIQNKLHDIPVEIIREIDNFNDFGIDLVEIGNYLQDSNGLDDFANECKSTIEILEELAEKQRNKCIDINNRNRERLNNCNAEYNIDKLIRAYIKNKDFKIHNCATIYNIEFNQIKGRLENFYSWGSSALANEFENLRTISKYLLKTYLTYNIDIKCTSLINKLNEYENKLSSENFSLKDQAYGLRFALLEEIQDLHDTDNDFVKWFKSETYTGKDD